MMNKKIDLNKITNHEIKIYVETAAIIMEKCLEKAKPRNEDNVYSGLSDMISEKYDGLTPDSKFLRNLSDKIKKLRDPAYPELEMVIYTRNLLVLTQIAEVENYEILKKEYHDSLFIPVMYTPRRWNFFDLIRVPQSGVLMQSQLKWAYNENNFSITGNVSEVTEITMPGDRHPLWVQVDYIDNDQQCVAYFAEHINESIIPLTPASRILSLFEKLKALSNQS